ncbi:MAG: hypothetical protein PHQ43_13200, partial [Dehalococcoidales bacterium]|nr:hypothetical protein [Dehalococcoidales bacterium]
MLELRTPPLATVSPGVPKTLQEGYYVRFSDAWPETLNVKGQTFRIERTNQVPYDLSYILPVSDFRDVDLSNSVGGGEGIYPEQSNTLYEIEIGFKPGNYLAHFYLPAGEFVSRLEQANMTPDVTSA